MVAFRHSAVEFLERHDHGIDLAPKEVLSSGYISNDILETHFSDYKEIDIAFLASLAASEGAIQESDGDASGQRSQCRPQYIHNAGRLGNKAFQLFENRALGIRLEKNLVIFDRAKDNTCIR
jgi:hypothetical protein